MNSNDYFEVSIKKETVDNMKTAAAGLAEMVRENAAGFDAVNAVDGAYENDLLVVDQCIVPTEHEIPIRQYNIARLSTPLWKKAYGRLQVTNKRVVFRSTGRSLAGPVMIENEFSLEELGGVEIKSDYRFDILTFLLSGLGLGFLAGIYSCIAGLFTAWCNSAESVLPMVLLSLLTVAGTVVLFLRVQRCYTLKSAAMYACGISIMMCAAFDAPEVLCTVLTVISMICAMGLWIYSGIVDDLHILIKVKGAIGTIEIGRKLRKDERSGFSIVRPWKDTEIAIREIGALLDDVKRFGDAGINKWKV